MQGNPTKHKPVCVKNGLPYFGFPWGGLPYFGLLPFPTHRLPYFGFPQRGLPYFGLLPYSVWLALILALPCAGVDLNLGCPLSLACLRLGCASVLCVFWGICCSQTSNACQLHCWLHIPHYKGSECICNVCYLCVHPPPPCDHLSPYHFRVSR